MKQLFTSDMKLSDIIDMDYNLVQVISRMGIDLRRAGLSASEACAKDGIDPSTFMLICNVYSFPEHQPSNADISAASIKDILRYLRGSHLYYTGTALGNLENAFDRLVSPCDEGRKKAVLKFFFDYKAELEKHFAREEDQVFPYVEALLAGVKPEGYSIDQFEEHHESVVEKLEDMKNFVMKYLPLECDKELKMWVLLSVCLLRDDLRRHTFVEDCILVPIVRNLEKVIAFDGSGVTEDTHRRRDTSRKSVEGELSAREKEILVCVAKGMLNKEIADKLNLSIYTVITHRKNITRKTGIKTVAGLTVYALLNNLIDMSSVQ
jgi:regulator of cell morphogenesis and NO signaling